MHVIDVITDKDTIDCKLSGRKRMHEDRLLIMLYKQGLHYLVADSLSKQKKKATWDFLLLQYEVFHVLISYYVEG